MKKRLQFDTTKRWYRYIPHPIVMLFGIMVLVAIMSYVVPAGAYDRELVDGRQRVIPGSYHHIEQTPLSLLDLFRAIPGGFKTASDIIFIVLASGIMFGILERSKMVEHTIGTVVRHLGHHYRFAIIVFLTFIYGFLGVVVGYENNIAMIPIAAIACLALGGDLMLAAGVGVGGVTVGFGLSPINPYTVGTGHRIAELPLFSGAPLRALLCFAALSLLAYYNVRYFKKILKTPEKGLAQDIDTDGFSLNRPLEAYEMSKNNWVILSIFSIGILTILYGVFAFHWYINEISAVFLMVAICAGIASGMSGRTISDTALKSVSVVAPGAFMVGFANAIKVAMEMGHISDTVAFNLASVLETLPSYSSAVSMSIAQCVINLFIPSGSGQALATLPIMIPVGELVGLTRQTSILAFQIGDGVTNLFNPALGGLIAMLSMCRIPFDRWLRFIFPFVIIILLIAWCFLVYSVSINWGPA